MVLPERLRVLRLGHGDGHQMLRQLLLYLLLLLSIALVYQVDEGLVHSVALAVL